MKVAILDYEAGNLRSVQNAFRKLGAEACIITKESEIKDADGLVVPGVGSFSRVRNIAGMKSAVLKFAREKPFLGICLGMQILFEGSEESREKGLGIFKGKLGKLKAEKVPQMGWNTLEKVGESPLLEGIGEKDYFYFVHSYAVKKSAEAIAITEYGEKFVSAVGKGNIYGVQFHPEKSGEKGLAILKNFLALCRR